MSVDPLRLLTAGGVLLAYALMCLAIARGQMRRQRAAAALEPAAQEAPLWIVAYASQTGTAEALGWQTANTLHLAGQTAHLCSLGELNTQSLRRAERVLFVTSTYGEGDPPDNAAAFVRRVMAAEELVLAHLHYAVLALGDDTYARFCGFGRALEAWLLDRGARPLFERIEVNRGDPAAMTAWRQQLGHLAGTGDAPDWSAPPFADWRLVERRVVNPGSAGGPVCHLEFEPVDAPLPQWSSGDLAQVSAPGDPGKPREYSIASIPEDGRLHLLVRQHFQPDGRLGVASGWLTRDAGVGECVSLRVRAHRLFQLGDNAARPLILIGNGTGLAGLRSHLKARARRGEGRNWLVFGERNAAADSLYREEIDAWQASGVLARVDRVFSRDQPRRRYVQDHLREAGAELRNWVDEGAAIYVCGSLEGMAAGVDEALAELLGRERLEALGIAGRYRRDVY